MSSYHRSLSNYEPRSVKLSMHVYCVSLHCSKVPGQHFPQALQRRLSISECHWAMHVRNVPRQQRSDYHHSRGENILQEERFALLISILRSTMHRMCTVLTDVMCLVLTFSCLSTLSACSLGHLSGVAVCMTLATMAGTLIYLIVAVMWPHWFTHLLTCLQHCECSSK